jgi:hypothetical protein
VVFDQQDQQRQSLTSTAWAKTVEIGEIVFLIGALLVIVHFVVGLAALVCSIGKIYTSPLWFWIELRVLVYPLALIMWLRLLFVVSTYNLRPSQKKNTTYILGLSIVAFLLALNPFASYAGYAFPLLAVAYAIQFVLDARLTKGSRRVQRQHSPRSNPHFSAASQVKSRLYTPQEQEQRTFYPQGIVESLKHKKFKEDHTPMPPTQRVGIWYSSADERFANQLRTHLQPKIRQGAIDLWDAHHIQPGALWQEERTQAVHSAGVAVLLISAELMASELIARDELPQLLYRAMAQRTVVLRLHISPCNFEGTGLERFHPVNSPDKPLAKLERSDRDKVLAYTAQIIYQRLGLAV